MLLLKIQCRFGAREAPTALLDETCAGRQLPRSHRGTCAAHLLLAKAPVGEGDAVTEKVGPSEGVPEPYH